MQRALDRAGFRRRDQLRPRQIHLEEIVGHHQPAALVAVEQMMAAGNPEIVHLRSRPAMPIRSTVSPGSLVLALDLEEGERARRLLSLARTQACGRSRAPRRPSNVRCTATSVSCGWLHSDSAKATSSSAAARRRSCRARRNARPAAAPADRPASARSVVARLDDLHQRRPAERRDAEKAAAERRARLAFERRRIAVPEHEGAGHRPFARLGRLLEDERVRRIEP